LQGRRDRRGQGPGDRAGQAQDHGQLRGAGADRHRDPRRAGAGGGDPPDDPGGAHGHSRGSGRGGEFPDVRGGGVHYPPGPRGEWWFVLMKRVVVTGMAGITSLGSDWPTISANFKAGKSGIRRMDEWDRFSELNTRLGGPVDDFVQPKHWTRKQTRSMGRVSKLA